jgi:hypothetical protein
MADHFPQHLLLSIGEFFLCQEFGAPLSHTSDSSHSKLQYGLVTQSVLGRAIGSTPRPNVSHFSDSSAITMFLSVERFA